MRLKIKKKRKPEEYDYPVADPEGDFVFRLTPEQYAMAQKLREGRKRPQ